MTTKPRSSPQNRAFHALCGNLARQHPLVPYRSAFACEAWKRYLVSAWVREARMEAWCAGRPDPFPSRPVPSSDLTLQQMSDLLEFANAWCALRDIELSK